MPPPRIKPTTSPRAARRIALVNAERRERLERVVEFMDAVEGRGWARRMEKRDCYMDQDYPTVWLSGRKLVSRRNLIRLEDYAARFGYVAPHVFMRDVRALNKSLSELASS